MSTDDTLHRQPRSLTVHHHLHETTPFIDLTKVIGMGVASYHQVVFSRLGSRIFFTCQAIVVAMETVSLEQQFYIGHTDKVICIALSGDELLLVSAQLGGVVRIWSVSNTTCVRILYPSHQSILTLSLSYSGSILCSIGRHSTGRNQITVWKEDDVIIKSLTNVHVNVLRIAPFDDSRFISAGWNNIRFWRVKESSLKSSPINLQDYHHTSFTDIQFEASNTILTNRHIYSSTSTGCIVEVEYHSFIVKRVWQLFPDIPGGVAITSLALHEGLSITGSTDGCVRVWSIDFEHVAMETDHDSSIIAVGVAKDGHQILSATTGSIGILDANNKKYKTIVRSHTGTITGMSMSPCGQWLATASKDGTIRIWDHSFQQMYQFTNEEGDIPTVISIHPITSDLGVGYESGSVRFISLITGAVLSEHKHQSVTSIVFTNNGRRCFSSDSKGTLALYDATHTAYPLLTILGNTVSNGCIVVSEDCSILAIIGPLSSLVTLYSTHSLEQIISIDIATKRETELPHTVCFTNDVIGHVIILTNQNRLLKYAVANGQFISEYSSLHDSGCCSVAVSNQYLITGGRHGDIKVWKYDMRQREPIQVFNGHCGSISHLLVSHDLLITSSDGIIYSWNITSNNNNNQLQTPPTSSRSLPISSGWPRKIQPHPTTPQGRAELLKATPTPITPSLAEDTDEIIINQTPQGGVELTLTTPTQSVPSVNKGLPYKAMKHYRYHPPTRCKPTQLFLVPPTQSSIVLDRVGGFSESGRSNIHWSPKEGIIYYSSGSIIVKDDINNITQKLLVGHPTQIATLALSNDGCGLASSSYCHKDWPCEVRLWDLESNECMKILHHHDIGVNCLAYSFDDRYLLSIGDDLLLCIYGINQSIVLVSTPLSLPIHDIKWDPSIAYEFATVGVNGVRFWMFEEPNSLQVHKPLMPSIKKESTVLCYTTHRYLYVGGLEGIVSVWNTMDNSCHFLWKTGCAEIGSMCCNNRSLIVGGAGGVVQLWTIDPSVSKPTAILECSLDLVGGVYSMSFDSSLKMGVVGTNTIYFINWSDQFFRDLSYSHHGNITGISYSSDGRVLVSCDNHGTITIWKTSDWLPLLQYKSKKECTAVTMIDHTPQLICACGYNDGALVSYSNGKVLTRHYPHKSAITKLMSSVKDNIILSGSSEGVVMATDIFHGVVISKLALHQGAAISDIDVKIFPIGLPDVVSVNQELWLVSSDDQRVSLWCKETLFEWITFPTNKQSMSMPTLARFCPAEPDYIMFTGYGLDCCLQIYSLTQKTVIRKLSLNYWPTAISLCTDGQLIAIGSKEQVLTIMDTEGTFQESSTHCHALSSLAFSPNGRQLVSTSLNNFHIWQVQ